MDAKIKRKWVDALTSGMYAQCKNGLRRGGGYCCLGVARYAIPELSKFQFDNKGYLLDEELDVMGITDEDQGALANLNDHGVPFDMIAGLIDEAL